MVKERTDNMRELFPAPPVLAGERLCLRPLAAPDAEGLSRLVREDAVYRFLPTFLFEKQYAPAEAIARLYDEGLRDSLILGVFSGERFCGLAEMYGFKDQIHKISVGYRLLEECWGRGLATEALKLMIRYLYDETDIEIITASSMIENRASARVLTKNGFTLVESNAPEDWGFDHPVLADKWIA